MTRLTIIPLKLDGTAIVGRSVQAVWWADVICCPPTLTGV